MAKIYENSKNPALGLNVTTLYPDEKYAIPINHVKVRHCGQVVVETDFTYSIQQNVKILFDIQRDGESIIGGYQIMSNKMAPSGVSGQIGNVYGTFTTCYDTVDKQVTKGRHNYKIILYNSDLTNPFTLIRYATLVKAMTQNIVNSIQAYPVINEPAAITLASVADSPNNIAYLSLRGTRRDGLIKLNLNVNVRYTSLLSQLMFEIFRADGSTVTNGRQVFGLLSGPDYISIDFIANFNFIFVDNQPSEKYTVIFDNQSVAPIELDFYSFFLEYHQASPLEYLNIIPPFLQYPDVIQAGQRRSWKLKSENCESPKVISFLSNFIFSGIYSSSILIDVRKNGKSIINGNQPWYKVMNANLYYENNIKFVAIDSDSEGGEYEVSIVNYGQNSIALDYLIFIVQ